MVHNDGKACPVYLGTFPAGQPLNTRQRKRLIVNEE